MVLWVYVGIWLLASSRKYAKCFKPHTQIFHRCSYGLSPNFFTKCWCDLYCSRSLCRFQSLWGDFLESWSIAPRGSGESWLQNPSSRTFDFYFASPDTSAITGINPHRHEPSLVTSKMFLLLESFEGIHSTSIAFTKAHWYKIPFISQSLHWKMWKLITCSSQLISIKTCL
jgi:hypothetical protein